MTDGQQRTSLGRMRARVRALLAERFQLAIHKDSKEFPIYALVLAWTPDQRVAPPGEGAEGVNPPDLTGPSILTAIQEQL